MSTPSAPKIRPAKPVKKRSRTKRFSQSLFVIDGLFDGEDLIVEHSVDDSLGAVRLPATLAPKSIVAPGDRGEFVCYLRSLKSDNGYCHTVQLVRLRRENDPHVKSLKNSGFVAGQVVVIAPEGCLVRITPRRAHNTPPFEVWVNWSQSSAPRRPLRTKNLICLRVKLSPDGKTWYHSYCQPPVKWWAGRKPPVPKTVA